MPCVIFLFYYTVVEREAYSTGAPFTQFIPWNAKHIPMGRPTLFIIILLQRSVSSEYHVFSVAYLHLRFLLFTAAIFS